MEIDSRQSDLNIIKKIKQQFTRFIQIYQQNGVHKYKHQAQRIVRQGKHTLLIKISDFLRFDVEFCNSVLNEYYKFQPHLNQAFNQWMQQFLKNLALEDSNKQNQRYDIAFDQGLQGPGDNKTHSVRDLKSQHLGKLKSFRGTVTRTSQIRPQLIVGVFKCMTCGSFSKQVHQQFKYTEPKKCLRNNCDSPVWELDLKRSRFADFQKIRIQQDPTKIPPGSMPRSIDVILRNQNTQKGQPGDILHVVGYLCVSPDISSMLKPGQRTQLTTKNTNTRGNMAQQEGITGIKGVRQLNYKLVFIAIHLTVENNQFSEVVEDDQVQEEIVEMELQGNSQRQFTNQYFMQKVFSRLKDDQIKQVKQMSTNGRLYDDLSQSLFPSIFGHSQIKKALLLQLFGGIHKTTKTKINIRGDINILIVGDPSTAKSQFLKCVNKFVPRSVYTNGKTTSAAGLTASVTKDQNGNIGIQAGALMLADNGICCIDQFDKMDIKDQVAIHEAMQQQTISIAKAGVYATLNARTSILAAANPLFGRYDKSKALKYNINISAPIMSRFDLFFVICDQTNDITDINLARFIVDLHKKSTNKNTTVNYTHQQIKKYITVAKKFKPRITRQAAELLQKYYIELRAKDKSQNQNNSYRITVRQLQSMIRLSQAYARLQLTPEIKMQHVKQAYRLLSCSILKLQKSPIQLDTQEQLGQQLGQLHLNHNLQRDNLLQRQMNQRNQQKRSKHVSLSHQIYQQIQKNVRQFFKVRQQKSKRGEQQDVKVTQQKLIDFLLTGSLGSVLNSMGETEHMKKILTAVLKKLIREERMLVVLEESTDPALRILTLHPNFEQ